MGEKPAGTSKLVWLGVLQMLASVAEYAFDLVQNDLFTWALLGSGALTIITRILMGLFLPGVETLRVLPPKSQDGRVLRALLPVLMVVGACATLAWHVRADAPLAPRMNVTMSEDSIHVRLAWARVLDRRGNAVDHYEWVIRDGQQTIGSGTTSDTIALAAVAKEPGAEHSFTGSVHAVDVYGTPGDVATAGPFPVTVPLPPGPPAPAVQLDTIPLAHHPVVDSMRIFFPAGRFEGDALVMTLGDTLQGCVVAWRGGESFRPTGQAPICMQASYSLPAMLYRAPGRVVVRQAE